MDYWPVSIRAVHYQLFSRKLQWGGRRDSSTYPNTKAGQGDLIKIAKWGRLEGAIPWQAIDDETRTRYRPYKFADLQDYLKNELYYLLNDYQRCLVQDQQNYVEVWVEKHALFRVIKEVGQRYCVPVVACRGYDSITYLHNFLENALEAIDRGQTPTVLYFGDLDPSGIQMLEASIYTLQHEFHLPGARYERIAVNPEDVEAYGLPNDPEAGKYKDTRYKWYVQKYGRVFVELDAIHPRDLARLVARAIEQELDMKAFSEQEEVAEKDKERLNRIRQKIVDVINAEFRTHFSI
jgi:hypothetical protein